MKHGVEIFKLSEGLLMAGKPRHAFEAGLLAHGTEDSITQKGIKIIIINYYYSILLFINLLLLDTLKLCEMALASNKSFFRDRLVKSCIDRYSNII